MKPTVKSVAILMSLTLGATALPSLAAKLPPPVTQNGITTQTSAASDAFPGLKSFYNLPAGDRSQINVYYTLRVKHCDASQLRATLKDNGQSIPVHMAADGRLTPLPTREQLNGGATLELSFPETCTIGPKIHVFSTQAPGKTYDAAGLALGVRQGNAAMGKIAGVAAVMMKKLDRVYFVGGGSGMVEIGGQQKPLPRTGAAGEYPAGTPYFLPSTMAGAARITLSNPASIALFDTPD